MTPAEFEAYYGYAPEGERAIRTQFTIGNRSFSAIAMLGVDFLEALHVEEGTINSNIFCAFVDSIRCEDGDIAILDNAAIHKTAAAFRSLDRAFHGRYTCCAPYSPHLKPIEKLFGKVKKYLRDHEQQALLDPLHWINKAFDMFRYGGERQHEIRPLWRGYFRAHESFRRAL